MAISGASSWQEHLSYQSTSKKLRLWKQFCDEQEILNSSAPLFETDGLSVVTRQYGDDQRIVLQRSSLMEKIVRREVRLVIDDFNVKGNHLDGIIYMMFWKGGDYVLPLYIGKSEKFGLRGNLSANLKGSQGNSSNFARWGYNYAYHLGDLSAVVCPGHNNLKINSKYSRWAKKLFINYPDYNPVLFQETYFWAKAWSHNYIGIWKDYGATSLTFLEYLLIGVASDYSRNIY